MIGLTKTMHKRSNFAVN